MIHVEKNMFHALNDFCRNFYARLLTREYSLDIILLKMEDYMKKLQVLIITFIMVLSLTACGGSDKNEGAKITEDQKATLAQISQSLTDVHGKFAEYYDNFDDQTKDFVDEIDQMIRDIKGVLDGSVVLEDGKVEQFIEGSQGVLEAAETGWAEIEAQLAE